jgi:hypothetical protein
VIRVKMRLRGFAAGRDPMIMTLHDGGPSSLFY